jgi:hypothetical protein
VRRALRIAGIGLLTGLAVSAAASARCVRDVAESGVVGVRCSDGVRGRLAGDEVPPANPTPTHRPSNWSRPSRSEGSTSPANGNASPYQYQSQPGDSAARANDSAAGALTRQRTAGAGSTNDRRPY